MSARHFETIVLDYDSAASDDLLMNLSAVASHGPFLWTAADEGRSLECLRLDGDRYKLHRQIGLDDVFTDIPGQEKQTEIDIESVDIADGRLWICGSHCLVRKKPDKDKPRVLKPNIVPRPSRCLFGSIDLKGNGGGFVGAGQRLPFEGKGGLRERLAKNPFLSDFIDLPSKENGLDIEGMVVVKDKVMFGLRGPLIDSFAVVVEMPIRDGLRLGGDEPVMHFLDLGGLGVRDLAHLGSDLLVLAGPVSTAAGPFRIYRWKPRLTDAIQDPDEQLLDDWTADGEKPEGICCLEYEGTDGLLILYDKPNPRRLIRTNRYIADWFRLPD